MQHFVEKTNYIMENVKVADNAQLSRTPAILIVACFSFNVLANACAQGRVVG